MVRLEVKNLNKTFTVHTRGSIEVKGFENINLTTYGFQAPEFYKKCGFEVEFIRKNKENPKLDKYYLVKYFGGKNERN